MEMIMEPFHESREKWIRGNKNYRSFIYSLEDLKDALDEIHRNYNGYKTLSYQLPQEYNEFLLNEAREKDKIILIHRKNLLQAMVSMHISLQTNLWNVVENIQEMKDGNALREKFKQHQFNAMDLGAIRTSIKLCKKLSTHYKDFLAENKKMFLELRYEELFVSSRNERMKKIKEIYDFLELFLPQGEAMEKVESLFAPQRKVNDHSTYRFIPNIDLVEEELGSAENGYLFE